MNIRIPCDDACICVPICRNKSWSRMINECSLVMNLLLETEESLVRGTSTTIHIFSVNKTYKVSKKGSTDNGLITCVMSDLDGTYVYTKGQTAISI